MQLTYDQGADAVYVYFSRTPVARTSEVQDGIAIDYSGDGEPVGVEFLDVSDGIDLSRVPRSAEIAELLEGYPFPIFA
jgi:uncharacterized protein YuzE